MGVDVRHHGYEQKLWCLVTSWREATKNALGGTAAILSHISTPVVINSFGRSGSTLLYETVSRNAVRAGGSLAERLIRGVAWDLQDAVLQAGRCYKSHDYPPPTARDMRVLYVFGDPIDAAFSARRMAAENGEVWWRQHCIHLGAGNVNPDDVLRRDALRLGEHLHAWRRQSACTVGFVRYERLWESAAQLEDFLGFPLQLPERRPRQAQDLASIPDAMARAYGVVAETIRSMPDWSIVTAADSRSSSIS